MKIVVADPNLVPHRERFEAALPRTPECVGRWAVCHPTSCATPTCTSEAASPPRWRAPRRSCELIHIAGAGTDKVDFDALPPDTLVANTFHHEQSIAEYVVAAAVMLRRGFLTQDRAAAARHLGDIGVRRSDTRNPARLATPASASSASGTSASATWKLFRAFGCTAAAVTGSGRVPDCGLAWAGDTGELDRLMRECDVAVVSAPLNEHTEGMIGDAQLRALGPDGVLINVGRGPLVQERALYDALAGGVIRAAAIDVWYRYPSGDDVSPPSDLPFADLPNLLMTPHSSGVTRDTFTGRVDDIVANIGRLAARRAAAQCRARRLKHVRLTCRRAS